MSKFKEGDKVKRTHKDHDKCKKGNTYTVKKCTNFVLRLNEVSGVYDPEYFKLAEPEFKNGDEVEIINEFGEWERALYLGLNPSNEDGYVVYRYKDCFSTHTIIRHKNKKEYTLKECADALGVPLDEFRIKDE